MKKLIILISVLILVLSVTTVSADSFLGLYETIECEDFSMEIPEGLERPKGGYQGDPEHSISLWSGLVKDGELFRTFEISTLPLESHDYEMSVVDEYTEGDLKVQKCEIFDEYGSLVNRTYAEFDKSGKHFYLEVDYRANLEEINLDNDVKMVKELKDSIKVK